MTLPPASPRAVLGEPLDELLALAKKATPGPWTTDERFVARVYCDDATGSCVADCTASMAMFIPPSQKRANAEFIAACTPERIAQLVALARAGMEDTALLDLLDAKREDVVQGWDLVGHVWGIHGQCESVRDALRAARAPAGPGGATDAQA